LRPLPGVVDTIVAAVTDDELTGHDRIRPALLTWPLPAGVLVLTGPGAAAAARGLLVTAAYHSTSIVSVRPRDLRTLLPADHSASPPVVTSDAESIEHSRPGTGTVIALTDEPTATHHWHITADGTATGTGLTEPRRLCTLDVQTTIDLLTLTRPQPASTSEPDYSSPPVSGRPTSHLRAADPSATAYLTLLGGCHLTATGAPVRLRRTASLQILAYLAIHPHGATRNELTHAIWPNLPPAAISQRLHTTLTDLRQQLRSLLGDDPITHHDDRYRINTRAITTDLQQWRTCVHAMTHAVGTTAQLDACQDVINQYRGELAVGHNWPWLTPSREQARRTVIDACSVLAEHTDPNEALHWLQHAIAIDPYNEPLHQQAADLLRATGDETGAADLIKRLYHRLAKQSDQPH
jgi:DNA-binding SARP family transcriptional activator